VPRRGRFVASETHSPRAAVATLVGRGHANKLIAYELGITSHTVATHVKRIKSKLGIPSRLSIAELFANRDLAVAEGDREARTPPKGLSRWRVCVDNERFAVLTYDTPNARLLDHLSSAEREVLIGMLADKSNAEIGELRGTSERTVANQVASIFTKLGARSRSALCVLLRGS